METASQSNAFREFSTSFYAKEDVAEACLFLQDRYGADVILLLFCCWTGRHGANLQDDTLASAINSVCGWRDEVVLPLRQIRRRLKDDLAGFRPDATTDIRAQIAKIVIEAELLQIDHLFAFANIVPAKNGRQADRSGIVRLNLQRYIASMKINPPIDARDTLEILAQRSCE